MLPYEQYINGVNQEPNKPKATVTSAAPIKKPGRGRGPQGAMKKSGDIGQASIFP